MRIILVLNKTLNRNGEVRFDGGYYNTYIPMLKLGHEVVLYDTEGPKRNDFIDLVNKFDPHLIYCCLTGNLQMFPNEPFEEINQITKQGRIKTFNWFCDDTWRFESFSSHFCKNFTVCSTPEVSYLEKYKEIGYKNIILGLWHCNKDLSIISNSKSNLIGFCGGMTFDRNDRINFLIKNGFAVDIFSGCCYEEMFYKYSKNLIGINFSVNDNDPQKKTQMKLRPMEIVNAGSLLVTEYTNGLENLFKISEEVVCFSSNDEMVDKLKFYSNNTSEAVKIIRNSYSRFLRDHESHVRIKNVLDQINKI